MVGVIIGDNILLHVCIPILNLQGNISACSCKPKYVNDNNWQGFIQDFQLYIGVGDINGQCFVEGPHSRGVWRHAPLPQEIFASL